MNADDPNQTTLKVGTNMAQLAAAAELARQADAAKVDQLAERLRGLDAFHDRSALVPSRDDYRPQTDTDRSATVPDPSHVRSDELAELEAKAKIASAAWDLAVVSGKYGQTVLEDVCDAYRALAKAKARATTPTESSR